MNSVLRGVTGNRKRGLLKGAVREDGVLVIAEREHAFPTKERVRARERKRPFIWSLSESVRRAKSRAKEMKD